MELDFLLHQDLGDVLHEQGELLSVAKAAERIGEPAHVVRNWIYRGQVVTVRHEGRLFVGERSLYDCELARREAGCGRPRAAGGA